MKNNTIYVMKCLGILILIPEHTMTYQNEYYFDNPFICMTKAVLMPSFLILSGFVLAKKQMTDSWVMRKGFKLCVIMAIGLTLYWVWANIVPQWSMVTNMGSFGNFIAFSLYGGLLPTVLWYILVMLDCYIIFWIAYRFKTKRNIAICIAVVALIINAIPIYIFGLSLLKWYGLFMMGGYVIGLYQDRLKKYLLITYIGLGLFIPVGLVTNWMMNWQDIEFGRGGYTIILNDVLNGKFALLGVMLGVTFISVLAFVGVARLLNRIKYMNKTFNYIGGCTLGIYILHPLFVGVHSNIWVSSLINIVACLVIFVLCRYAYRFVRELSIVKEISNRIAV